MTATDVPNLPHKIAVLCYLYDARDRLLLIHRLKDPNRGMYSPIGGKLETGLGESPHDCAVREVEEEAGLTLSTDDMHLTGIVAETAYEGETHWLIFCFEVTRTIDPAEIAEMQIDEGTLEWVPVHDVASHDIPDTDRRIMWPLMQRHRGGGFFSVHIDCTGEEMTWDVQEERA